MIVCFNFNSSIPFVLTPRYKNWTFFAYYQNIGYLSAALNIRRYSNPFLCFKHFAKRCWQTILFRFFILSINAFTYIAWNSYLQFIINICISTAIKLISLTFSLPWWKSLQDKCLILNFSKSYHHNVFYGGIPCQNIRLKNLKCITSLGTFYESILLLIVC